MGEVMDGRVVAVAADAVGLESLVVVRAVVVSERVTPVQTKPVTADVRHGPQQTQEREEPEQGTAPHCDSPAGRAEDSTPRGSRQQAGFIAFIAGNRICPVGNDAKHEGGREGTGALSEDAVHAELAR
jgi:hypothetical protein